MNIDKIDPATEEGRVVEGLLLAIQKLRGDRTVTLQSDPVNRDYATIVLKWLPESVLVESGDRVVRGYELWTRNPFQLKRAIGYTAEIYARSRGDRREGNPKKMVRDWDNAVQWVAKSIADAYDQAKIDEIYLKL